MVKARMCEVYMRSADRAVLMHGGLAYLGPRYALWCQTRALQRIYSARQPIASVSPLSHEKEPGR